MGERSDDEAAIHKLFDTQRQGWERADAALFASVFTENADFVNITATPLRGREAIARHHEQLWATVYTGAVVTTDAEQMRFVNADLALIERSMTLRMGSLERHAHALTVATRHGDRWMFEATHNMVPFVPPSPAPGNA